MSEKLHCPDCTIRTLRVLSDEELLKMFPMCRDKSSPKSIKIKSYGNYHF